jgi:ABC-type transport system substrate-binding protein
VIEAAPSWQGARGNVGEVTIELEASPAVAAERWRSGKYDVLDDVLARRAVVDDETVLQRSPGMTTWYLGFNARRAPMDNARVRRALAHAVDRHGPAEALGGTATATGGLLPPTMPAHSHRVAPKFDPDRARALLNAAGFADGRAPGEIELVCLDLWEDAASNVAAQLAAVGVRVRLLPVTSDPDGETAIEEGAHAYIWAWIADYPDPGGGFLNGILRAYPWLYRDEELEQLLARAASLRDQDERLRAYREFERIWIGEKAAVVPLAYDHRKLWRRPWVTGMWANAVAMSTCADAVVSRSGPASEAAAIEQKESV